MEFLNLIRDLPAKRKEGKYPYLLLAPNLEEPSALKFAVNKYLLLY
jgi:hypothetical protein